VEHEAPEESFQDFFAQQGFGDSARAESGEDLFEALSGARADRAGGPLRGRDRERSSSCRSRTRWPAAGGG